MCAVLAGLGSASCCRSCWHQKMSCTGRGRPRVVGLWGQGCGVWRGAGTHVASGTHSAAHAAAAALYVVWSIHTKPSCSSIKHMGLHRLSGICRAPIAERHSRLLIPLTTRLPSCHPCTHPCTLALTLALTLAPTLALTLALNTQVQAGRLSQGCAPRPAADDLPRLHKERRCAREALCWYRSFVSGDVHQSVLVPSGF